MYSKSRGLHFSLAAGVLALAAVAAQAADSGAGPGLDGCLQAALKERPGFVHGWKDVSTESDERYVVSVINHDGKIADALCEAKAPGNFRFDDKLGLRRYDTYSRIAVQETNARGTAPVIFVGPVKIVQMEIDLDWKGHAAYEYHMILPSGREVVAQVDSTTGYLIHAELQ